MSQWEGDRRSWFREVHATGLVPESPDRRDCATGIDPDVPVVASTGDCATGIDPDVPVVAIYAD